MIRIVSHATPYLHHQPLQVLDSFGWQIEGGENTRQKWRWWINWASQHESVSEIPRRSNATSHKGRQGKPLEQIARASLKSIGGVEEHANTKQWSHHQSRVFGTHGKPTKHADQGKIAPRISIKCNSRCEKEEAGINDIDHAVIQTKVNSWHGTD